jgi:hypothetical protein
MAFLRRYGSKNLDIAQTSAFLSAPWLGLFIARR